MFNKHDIHLIAKEIERYINKSRHDTYDVVEIGESLMIIPIVKRK